MKKLTALILAAAMSLSLLAGCGDSGSPGGSNPSGGNGGGSGSWPDVPTLEEAGFGAVYSAPSRGYFLPKGVDAAAKEAIVKAFNEAINDADHIAELEALGLLVSYMEGDECLSFLKGQESDVIALKPALGWE